MKRYLHDYLKTNIALGNNFRTCMHYKAKFREYFCHNRKYKLGEVEDNFTPSALHLPPSGSWPSSGAPARQGLPLLPSPHQPHPSSHQPLVSPSPQSDTPLVGNGHIKKITDQGSF